MSAKVTTDFSAIGRQADPADQLSLPELSENIAQNFTFIHKLGEGELGSVYLVQENSTGDEFAIKLIRRSLLTDAVSVQRFNQEALAVSGLSHPNLVSLHDYAVPLQGAPYIVMEYVKGVDLASLLARHGPLLVNECLDVFVQVAEALVYAHGKGIIHRSLKPSNIMVVLADERGVKVLDLGLARMLRQNTRAEDLTENDEIIGAPYYMSPEQCRGDALDARADIYSLGCVMYEAVSGHPPFSQRNPISTILQHLKAKPNNFGETVSKQKNGKGLETAILKCLEKPPQNRYQSAEALLSDLLKVRDGNELKTVRLMNVVSKTPPSRWAMIATLIAISVSAIAMFIQKRPHTTAPPQAVPTIVEPSKEPDIYQEVTGLENKKGMLTILGDHYRIALDVTKRSFGSSMLSTVNLDDNDVRKLISGHRLSVLGLTGEPVTSKILPDLTHSPLTYLNLDKTKVSDKNIEPLSNLKGLQYLFLDATDTGTSATKAIGKLPLLEVLRLSNTRIGNGDLHWLEPIKTLRSLELANCHITDAGAGTLAKMPLEVLDIGGCDITDRGAAILATSKTLRFLSLKNNQRITDDGLKRLTELPLVALVLTGSRVSKTSDLSYFSSLHTLRLLVLDPDSKPLLPTKFLPHCVIITKRPADIFTYARQYSTPPDYTLFNMGRILEADLERQYNVAFGLYECNLDDLAIKYFTQYIQSRTKLPPGENWEPEKLSDALRFRAQAHARLKQYKEALADVNEALKTEPNHPILLNARAQYSEMLERAKGVQR